MDEGVLYFANRIRKTEVYVDKLEENETGFRSSIMIELGVIRCKTLITAEHSL